MSLLPELGTPLASAAAPVFARGGETGRLCRETDWAATPLGPVETWPQSLRTAASIVLGSGFPMVVVWGPERVQIYNDAYVPLIGRRHPRALGMPTHDCWPEIRHVQEPIFARVFRGETVQLTEALYHLPRNGAAEELYFDATFVPVPLESGEIGGSVSTLFEVTSRVAARALEAERGRLVDAEQQARAEAVHAAQVTSRITTHLAEGVCVMDAGGRLTYMNPAAERILGWTQAEVEGKVLHDVVHHRRPDGRPFPIEECPLGQVLSAARPVIGMADQWIRKDGSFVHLVTSCSPLVADGRVTGAVLSLHDDTERRRAEAERERLLREAEAARAGAEAANQAKADFLASMSHELRTPLNAVGGYVDLLALGVHGPVTEAQRAALTRITANQRHLLALINDILQFARLEAGRVEFALRPLAAAGLLRSVEPLIAPLAAGRGVLLSIEEPDPGLALVGDEERVRQVLLNLVTNAVKFTPAGGHVLLSCDAGADWLSVRVRDDGPGIPPEKQDAIFDPFVQVDRRLDRPQEGVGLGLAISRDLARGMGGELGVRSAPGEGSTFTLRLPRAPDGGGEG